ncbi:MAG: mechanosensitive ion channel domain-containing protein [Acidobacteriota bacterium]
MLNDLFDRIRAVFLAQTPSLFYAIFVLLIGFLASRLARRWLRAILDRSRIREDRLLKDFFLRVVSVSILLLAALTALSRVGIDVRTFIAGLGVTGIILGFALRDTLSNFAAGVLLLIYRPFRAGDLIEVEGTKGVVEELTIVNMRMTTTAGVPVIMPNSKVWGAKITNYSPSLRRRIEFTLKVREEDFAPAIKAIEAALDEDERILKEPAPAVRVLSVSNGAVRLTASMWTDPQEYDRVSGDEFVRLMSALSGRAIKIL